MSESEPIWVKSKWTAAELDKQTIEFRIPLKVGGIAYGFGNLSVRTRKRIDDRIVVEIEIKQLIGRWQERQTVFQIPQRYVDQIERHPNPKISKYRLMVA